MSGNKQAIDIKELERLRRYQTSLENEQSRYEPIWRNVCEWQSLPYTGSRGTKPGSEEFPTYQKSFDTWGKVCSEIFVSGMQGYATGRSSDWFHFGLEDTKIKENSDTARYLEMHERAVRQLLNRSNFYDEEISFLELGVNIGTAMMYVEFDRKTSTPRFKTLHPMHCTPGCDRFGHIDSLFREFWLSREEAVMLYGKDNLPDALANKDTEDVSVNTMFRFVQYIGASYHCPVSIPGSENYVSLTWCDVDTNKIVEAHRAQTFGVFAWRWKNNPSGGPLGVDSPGMRMLPNFLMGSSMKKDHIDTSQMVGHPPIKRTRGLSVNFRPWGMTDIDPGQDFAAVQVTGDLSWTQKDIDDAQEQIKQAFFYDFFLTLMRQDANNMRVGVAEGLQNEQAAIMSTMLSRLVHEFLEPMLEMMFYFVRTYMLYDNSVEMPSDLEGKAMKIDFISPLFVLQRKAHELNPTRQWISDALSVAQVKQDVLDKIDWDQWLEISANAQYIDHRVVVPQARVDMIRQLRAKQQQQQQQQQQQIDQAKAQAQVYGQTIKAPQDGSPVKQQMQQQPVSQTSKLANV